MMILWDNLPTPSSQWLPVTNGAHAHVKPLTVTLHVPPFKQGLLEHSSAIEAKNNAAQDFTSR